METNCELRLKWTEEGNDFVFLKLPATFLLWFDYIRFYVSFMSDRNGNERQTKWREREEEKRWRTRLGKQNDEKEIKKKNKKYLQTKTEKGNKNILKYDW